MSLPVYESRESATLGSYFRDIYRDGELFCRDVPMEVAEWAIKNQEVFLGNVNADISLLRTWILESEFLQETD